MNSDGIANTYTQDFLTWTGKHNIKLHEKAFNLHNTPLSVQQPNFANN